MQTIQLGQSDLRVTPICLGTMTFGEQVSETDAHAILDRAGQGRPPAFDFARLRQRQDAPVARHMAGVPVLAERRGGRRGRSGLRHVGGGQMQKMYRQS